MFINDFQVREYADVSGDLAGTANIVALVSVFLYIEVHSLSSLTDTVVYKKFAYVLEWPIVSLINR